jgi:putative membrane protein
MPHPPGFVDVPLPDPAPAKSKDLTTAADPALLDAEANAGHGQIEHNWAPSVISDASPGTKSVTWIASGLALLVVGWVALSIVGFVADQFARSAALGVITLTAFVFACALLARGCWAELRSYLALRQVDELRTALDDTAISPTRAKEMCETWLGAVVSQLPEPNLTREAFEKAATVAEVKAVLRGRVLGPLREIARRAGQRAAIQAGAAVAITPSPALDGLFAGVRAVLVIRQIARIYGLRPGLVVTFGLLHRVAWMVASVSGVELVARTATDHVLEKVPVISHLAGAVPGVGVAAFRLYRLADITAEACSPLPE